MPNQLSHRLWDNWLGIVVGQEKSSHPVDIGSGESTQPWEGFLQVRTQTVDHRVAPAFGLLTADDLLANLPIQSEEFAIDGESGFDLGIPNALLVVV